MRKGVWIIGGDGWAYDIGFGGLDHVLSQRTQRQHPRARHRGLLQHRRPGVEGDAPGRGGQVRRRRQERAARRTSAPSPGPTATSTSPRSPSAPTTLQATKALLEADAWPGPSLVIAYSTCIAHGIDMSTVDDPPEGRRASPATGRCTASSRREAEHGTPFQLDSQAAVDPGRRVRRHRGPLRRAGPHPPGTGRRAGRACCRPTPTSAGATTPSSRTIERTVPHSTPVDVTDGRRHAEPTARRRLTDDRSRPPRYLGLDLRSPIVASAGPLTGDLDTARRLVDAGAVGASCCRRCSRRRSSTSEIQLNLGPRGRLRALRRGARLLPRRRADFRERRSTATSPTSSASRRPSTSRSSPASTPRRRAAGSATPACSADAGADGHRAQRLPTSPPTRPGRGAQVEAGRPRPRHRRLRRRSTSRWR